MTVTIVIPTFRRGSAVQSLVESLVTGSRQPDEIVVVDNDPEDSCPNIDGQGIDVEIVRARMGINLSAARNAGWRAATSDLCLFIDDDNIVEPDMLELLVGAFDDSGAAFVAPVNLISDTDVVWTAGVTRNLWTGKTTFSGRGALRVELDIANANIMEAPNAFVVRRSVLERLSGFDEDRFPFHNEDADLQMRIAALGLHGKIIVNAFIHHYNEAVQNFTEELLRAYSHHGAARIKGTARSRVRFHRLYGTGPQRACALCLFIPLWFLFIAVGVVVHPGSVRTRIAIVSALVSGLVDGYRR